MFNLSEIQHDALVEIFNQGVDQVAAAMSEIGNIILNSCMSTLANISSQELHGSLPTSQTLHKAPLPLYHCAADADKGERIQQAAQVLPIEFAGQRRHCLIQVTDVSMAVAREKRLREQVLELQTQTLSDGLTGIANRRRFDAHLDDEFRRAKCNGSPLSPIMVDVDFFKNYNDNYGHQQGDQCLIQIAAALSRG